MTRHAGSAAAMPSATAITVTTRLGPGCVERHRAVILLATVMFRP